MLITAFVLFALTNMACFYIDYKQNHPFLLIWAFNVPFVVIPFFYSIVTTSVEVDVLFNVIIFSLLCNLTYLITNFIFIRCGFFHVKCFNLESINSGLNEFYSKVWLYFTLSLLLFIIILYFPNYESSRGGALQLGAMYAIMFMSSFLYLFYEKKSPSLWLAVIGCLFFLIVFKSRGALAYVIVPFIFIYIIKGINFKKLAFLFMTSIVLLMLVIFIKSYRWLSNDGGGDFLQLMDTAFYIFSVLLTKGELALINNFYGAYIVCENSPMHCYNWTLIDKLLIARFTDEPTLNAAYVIWNLIEGNPNVGGSLHSLSYGVSFFDGKWFGVIYFFFLSFFRVQVFYLMKNTYSLMFLGPVIYFTLFFSRGSMYNAIMPLIACFIIYFIVRFVNKKFRKPYLNK